MKSKVKRLNNKIKMKTKNKKCSNERNKGNLKLMSMARKVLRHNVCHTITKPCKILGPRGTEQPNNLTVDLEARYTYQPLPYQTSSKTTTKETGLE